MSAFILLSGKLERAPETRTSKNGNNFAMATLDLVLALRQPPRERKPKEKTPPPATSDRSRLDRHAGDGRDEFGDEIPF